MEILDDANTGTYGHPEPTKVSTAWKSGLAIVVTGHDLLDLELLYHALTTVEEDLAAILKK